MKKRKIFRWIFLLFFFFLLTAGGVGLYVWHATHSVPEFYSALEITPEKRVQAEVDSDAMELKFHNWRREIRKSSAWILTFTQDELNHWLAIAIGEKRPGIVPHQLSNPRGEILENGHIRVGVTVNAPEFQGVVSMELIPRVVEPNVVVVDFVNISVGKMKIIGPRIWGRILSKVAQDAALPIEVHWHDGTVMMTIRFRKGDLYFDNRSIELHTLHIDGKNVQLTGLIHKLK
ncbi:MAG: hypothetical protein Q4C70_08540 [Planctomycetia bacterium]|nr:hypothetical protein [Planctomycetia bacterium]